MKTIRLYVDMDGTIAKFYHHKQYLEKMYEQGYFANLKPYAILNTIKQLASKSNIEVFILSACVFSPYCEDEKLAWLDKYLPEIDDDHRILVNVGENKADYIDYDVDTINVLLDDYSRNLYEWNEYDFNNIGIKFVNGINDKTNKDYSLKVRNGKQLENLLGNFALYGIWEQSILFLFSRLVIPYPMTKYIKLFAKKVLTFGVFCGKLYLQSSERVSQINLLAEKLF